jgi:DNA-binding beta-propeller fold protein YncE
MGMVVNPEGEVLITDTANDRIRKVRPGADAASTTVWTIAGSGLLRTRLGPGDVADIVAPAGLALMPDRSSLVVSDSGNNVVRVIIR